MPPRRCTLPPANAASLSPPESSGSAHNGTLSPLLHACSRARRAQQTQLWRSATLTSLVTVRAGQETLNTLKCGRKGK